MLVHTEHISKSVVNRVTWWTILDRTVQEIRQGKTASAIVRALAIGLSEVGFQILIGELDPHLSNLKVKFFAQFVQPEEGDGLSVAEMNQVEFQPIRRSHPLALSTLGIVKSQIKNKTPELIILPKQRLQQALGTNYDRAWENFSRFLPVSARDSESLPVIIAPLFIDQKDVTNYLLSLTRTDISVDDLSLVSTFIQAAAMAMENLIWQKEVKTQKRNQESLRAVSKIVSSVSSNLDPDTVLTSILEELAKVIPYDSAAVSLEREGYLKLEAGRGFDKLDEVVGIVVSTHDNILYEEMTRTQLPIVINDVRDDPRYTFWAGTKPIRSWIGVPLILRDEIIGQISIDSFKKQAFKEEDGVLAFAFAQHVATAIQNARLFNDISRNADELRALLEGAKDVSSSLRTERVIYLMANRLKELMNATVIVYLLQNVDDTLTPVVFLEMRLDQLTNDAVRLAKSAAWQAMEAKHGVIINPLTAQVADTSRAERLRPSLLAAPFIVQDQAVGAITVVREDGPQFAQQGLDLLTRFTLQTGVAIDNSRLYEQLSRRLARENLLNKLSRRMSSKLSLSRMVADVMQTAREVSGADLSALLLKDPSQETAYLGYFFDDTGLEMQHQVSIRPGLATLVMEKRHIIVTTNYRQEAYADPDWPSGPVGGAIAVPITTGDKVLGALGLFKLQAPFTNSDEILNTLESIGWQASVSIENALLFQQVNEYAFTLEEKVKERTAELQKHIEQTSAILESAADAICITSAERMIEYINPAFTDLTGYQAAEVENRPFDLLLSDDTDSLRVDQMWNTVFSGKTWRGDVKNRRKDGSMYDGDLTIAPIFDSQGQVDKFVAIQRDISKKTELDRLKTEFLVTASHELRTPLTTVTGYAELLLNRNFSKSETDHFLTYIYDQAKHLSNLVSDLLDVSRIEAGATFVLAPQRINPRLIFKQLVEQWQETSPNHDVTLVEPEEWSEINVDVDRLKQIMNNLLSNAIKYAYGPQGGPITVTVKRNITNLLISVTDQGNGMTLDEQQHLFEKFWRGDAGSVAIEGTGLGMVIVKHLIESHGGKIWVTSQKNVGTTVNFTLPLLDSAATILIVEDDVYILALQEKLLRSAGYHVITATTGQEGLDTVKAEYPDLVILDLMLPEIDGEEVLRKLKSDTTTKNIPIVVVSAKSALANIEYTFTLGAADFLTKPFDFDEYLGRIKIALLNKPA